MSIGATASWLLISFFGGFALVVTGAALFEKFELRLPFALSQSAAYTVVIALLCAAVASVAWTTRRTFRDR